MIEKNDLKEGMYYLGTCRNTNIAKWFNNEFIFINMFGNKPYIETIPYFGDVKLLNTDGFIPTQEVGISFDVIRDERIKQDYKNSARKFYRNLNSVDMKDEKWIPIAGYEELYCVSNLGRVKKYCGNKIMKQNFSREYLVVGLSKKHERRTHRVHRLVAVMFKNGYDPTNEVNHINGVKSDNRDTNLEWIKHSENSKHSFLSGNRVKKLTPEMVVEIKTMLRNGDVGKEIATKYGVSPTTISEINTNKKWVNISI